MTEEILDKKFFPDRGIRPNAERAKWAQYLIWTVMILDVISFFSSYMQLNLLYEIKNGEYVTDAVVNSNDAREGIIGILQFVLLIVSGVIFIMWFRRAYYNLGKRVSTEHTDGWAAGSWFVPILSLFRPFQMMKELWLKTTKLINAKSPDKVEKNEIGLLGIWWALWIITSFVGNYVTRTAFKAETVENFISSTISDMVLSVLGIPLAILAVLIIRKYALKEERLNELERNELIEEKAV